MTHNWFELAIQLAKRELQMRYRGSALGILWALITPLSMLLVFTFVFGVIFKTRWGSAQSDPHVFAIILFAGLIVFNLFSDVVNRAPSLIVGQPNLVKKVVFPLDVLPVASLLAALQQTAVAVGILVIAQIVLGLGPHWTAMLLPVVLVPLCLATLGLAWFLAALGVYVRDIVHVVPPVVTALMFLTPVFYPPQALPDWMQPFSALNPLAYAVNDVRNVLVFGVVPDILNWLTGLALSALVAGLGFLFFAKTRKGFADVL